MKVFIVFILFSVVCHAQTNVIYGNQQDFTGVASAGNAVVTTVYPNPRSVNGVLISPAPKPITLSTNGEFWITNMPWGQYNIVFDSGLQFQFPIATNTFGSNNIANLANLTLPSFPPAYYLLNGSSTVFITFTNGAGIKFVPVVTNVINGFTNISYQISTN